MSEVLYRGSVKEVVGPFQTNTSGDTVVFRYTDAFSVFDWGKMPDLLPGKGAALALLAADLFEKLAKPESWKEFSKSAIALQLRKGISQIASATESPIGLPFNELCEKLQREGLRTHYLGVIPENEYSGDKSKIEPISLSQLKKPTPYLAVRRVSVVKPREATVLGRTLLDYQSTRTAPTPRLIPLEIVFRFGCPGGSSLVKRVQKTPDYLSTLPFPQHLKAEEVKAGAKWDFPLIEFFTKLESTDRPVSVTEALAISGLSAEQLQDMVLKSVWVCGFLRQFAAQHQMELADGKLEWALDSDGQPFLVDAIGPDELRLLAGEVQLSKEFLRGFYRDTRWGQSLDEAKKRADEAGASDWKRYVSEPVPTLPPRLKEMGTQIYQAVANTWTKREWFTGAWKLEKLFQEITQEREKR